MYDSILEFSKYQEKSSLGTDNMLANMLQYNMEKGEISVFLSNQETDMSS